QNNRRRKWLHFSQRPYFSSGFILLFPAVHFAERLSRPSATDLFADFSPCFRCSGLCGCLGLIAKLNTFSCGGSFTAFGRMPWFWCCWLSLRGSSRSPHQTRLLSEVKPY